MATEKKLKVRMIKLLANVWHPNEIIAVTHAYAKNFLVPKGYAVLITPEEEKRLEQEQKKKFENASKNLEERFKIKDLLTGQTLSFTLKGSGEKIFGGISEHDIVNQIEKQFNVKLERKNIVLPEGKHLKKAGDSEIRIVLGADVQVRLAVLVTVA